MGNADDLRAKVLNISKHYQVSDSDQCMHVGVIFPYCRVTTMAVTMRASAIFLDIIPGNSSFQIQQQSVHLRAV